MKKFFLLSLVALMATVGCADLNSGDSSLQDSTTNPTSDVITSEDHTSEQNTTTETITSEELSSEDLQSSEINSSSEEVVTSETPSSEAPTSSEGSSSSENKPLDIDYPSTNLFIDEAYETSYYVNPASYNIPEVVPTSDPYYSIDTASERTNFHTNNFNRATSYEDAMYRTNHYLISGDVKDTADDANYDLNHIPFRKYRELAKYRIDEGYYTYRPNGDFESYTINNLEGKVKKIYYGAAYVTLEDVAAYVFAFLDAPANWSSNKTGSIGNWGIYKRFNDSYFSANTDKYKYEPDVPRTDFDGRYEGEGVYKYYEMDFGYTQTGWTLGYSTYSKPYNNGSSITRGAVRLVYTARTTDNEIGAKYIPLEHRHVFLTMNHYNDFIEYLNYENGWGIPFGWMSAGNEYVSGMNNGDQYGKGYYEFDEIIPKTTYEQNMVYRYSYQNVLELANYLY